jgi:hypothetical protein
MSDVVRASVSCAPGTVLGPAGGAKHVLNMVSDHQKSTVQTSASADLHGSGIMRIRLHAVFGSVMEWILMHFDCSKARSW